MNNYGYLMTKLAELEREELAKQDGKVGMLEEIAMAVAQSEDKDEVRAQLNFIKKQEREEPPYGSTEWHQWRGENEAIAQAEEKLTQISHDLEFVPDYHPPEPQYKKEVEEWVQNKLKELGHAG